MAHTASAESSAQQEPSAHMEAPGCTGFCRREPTPISPVCVVGPLFLDIVMTGLAHPPRPGEEQWVDQCAIMPGGCANQAVALARLGIPVTLRSYLGQDDAGALVAAHLQRDGIDISDCVARPQQNVTVSLAFDGDRAMTTVGSDDAPTLESMSTLPSALVADLRAIADNRDTITSWKNTPGSHTTVIGDVGWDATGAWDPRTLDDLDLVDVFVPNEGEAQRYTRTSSPTSAARHLAERVPLAIVTRGAQGVLGASENELISLPALNTPVIDTTGAGDSFTAGLLWALCKELPLRAALSAGSLTAAYTLSKPGGSANAPTLSDLSDFTTGLHARGLIPAEYDLCFLDALRPSPSPRRSS